MHFTPCDNWKTLFLTGIYRCSEIFFKRHVLAFLEESVLKEVRNLSYLLNNNTVLLPKVQCKAVIYYILSNFPNLITFFAPSPFVNAYFLNK